MWRSPFLAGFGLALLTLNAAAQPVYAPNDYGYPAPPPMPYYGYAPYPYAYPYAPYYSPFSDGPALALGFSFGGGYGSYGGHGGYGGGHGGFGGGHGTGHH